MVAADRGKRKFATGAFLLLLLFLFFSLISVSFLINIIANESQKIWAKVLVVSLFFLLLFYSSTFFGEKKIQDPGLAIIFKHCDASTYISRLLWHAKTRKMFGGKRSLDTCWQSKAGREVGGKGGGQSAEEAREKQQQQRESQAKKPPGNREPTPGSQQQRHHSHEMGAQERAERPRWPRKRPAEDWSKRQGSAQKMNRDPAPCVYLFSLYVVCPTLYYVKCKFLF